MYLKDTWKLPPLKSECLSSWLYRTLLDRVLIIDKIESLLDNSREMIDVDYCKSDEVIFVLSNLLSITPVFIKSNFVSTSNWVIPRELRSSYCIECMKESIAYCGLPICRMEWAVVYLPFCSVHERLLTEGQPVPFGKLNASLYFFKEHWRNGRVNNDFLDKKFPWLGLACKVQRVLYQDPGLMSYMPYKILLQLFLSRELAFTNTEWGVNLLGKSERFFSCSKSSPRSRFQSYAFHACTLVRSKALCYLGSVMGLISDEEMRNKLSDVFYCPKSFNDIVDRVKSDMRYSFVDAAVKLIEFSVDTRANDNIPALLEGVKGGR